MDSDYTGGPQPSNFDAPLNVGDSSTGKQKVKWWNRAELYRNEVRICGTKIPAWRTVLSVLMIYGFYLGVDFTASLCTHGSKFICAVALIVSIVYIYWALWWDEAVIIPPSMTFFNVNDYHPVTTLVMVMYETTLIATAALVVATAMMFTYVELDDIFTWDC